MKWHNTAFKFKDIAEQTKKEMDEAGIKTDFFRTGDDDYWYVGWCPIGEAQYRKALKIITQHID